MATAEDIESPPYPTEGTTHEGLYNLFKALRKWVLAYRPAHNKLVGTDVIPTVKDLPDKKAYAAQPVPTQYGHWLTIRNLREQWDHLIRCYEDDWDNQMCVRQRVLLFQAAALLINGAFVPYEHREARGQRELEALQQTFGRIDAALMSHTEPQSHDPIS